MPLLATKPLKAYYTASGGGSGDDLLLKKTLVSAAQILAANVTPVEIIPAPPAGKVNIPAQIIIVLRYHGDAYAADHEWVLGYGDSLPYTEQNHLNTEPFDSTVSGLSWTFPTDFFPDLSAVQGAPWSMSPTSAMLGGTSTLEVWAYYRQIDAP